MDINGLRSFGLGFAPYGLHAWAVPQADGGRAVAVEPALQHRVTGVRLASRASGLRLREDAASVDDVMLQPSLVVDAQGNHVRWTGSELLSSSHLAARHGLAPQAFALPLEAVPVSDLSLGADDVLYLAGNGALWLLDLRGRFALTRLAAPAGFTPQRLASAAGGGIWALDVDRGRLARASGLPLFTRPVHVNEPVQARLAACDPNPDPPHWRVIADTLPAGEKAVALACSGAGQVLLMSLLRSRGGVRLRLLLDDGRLSLPLALAGPRLAHTLAWFDGEQIALATRGQLQGDDGRPRDPGVWLYALPAALLQRWAEASRAGASSALPPDLDRPLEAQGGYYPLAGWSGGPFAAARPGERLHYPRHSASGTEPVPVARVAGVSRARYGVVANVADGQVPGARVAAAAGLVDSRDPGGVWHRLYVEAAVPTGCALLVWLAAGEQGPPAFMPGRAGQGPRWHPHLIGDRSALPAALAAALPADLPRAAWVSEPTEQPLGQGLLCCASEAGRAGLFTVLIQRAGLAVRALQGARLWVTVELFGDGRATPELAALRAYAGRVSYRDRYLPALYHEQLFGSDAEQAGAASGADFLERFLLLFEGLFSDIEARIAASALVSDAMACPPAALPWLAGWVGLSLEPGLPTRRARWMLANASELARQHGTLAGLQRALDIATDGALTRGRIVVLEDFRLRRSLATILGARLEDARDPLTGGLSRSGNSVLGDALFLGDAQILGADGLKTFLALFRHLGVETLEDLAESAAARRALFDALAHRVTVLVHEDLAPDELGLVRRLAELGAPAHVQLRVVQATYPFMVGVAALVGADSYLRAAPPQRPVRVGPGRESSALGGLDRLRGEASLDAHAGAFRDLLPPAGQPTPAPVARISPADFSGANTAPFQLDGSASSAAPEHQITSYDWLHHPPP